MTFVRAASVKERAKRLEALPRLRVDQSNAVRAADLV